MPSQKSSGGRVGVPEAVAVHLIATFTGSSSHSFLLALHFDLFTLRAEEVTGNSDGSTVFILTNMCQAKVRSATLRSEADITCFLLLSLIPAAAGPHRVCRVAH